MQALGKRALASLVQQKRPFQTASKIAAVAPDTDKRMIQVKWEDGKVGHFPFVWLRDCAPPAAPTRTLTLNELNVQVKPEKLALDPQGERILIRWPPYHEVAYKSDWLREHMSCVPGPSVAEKLLVPWGRADLEKRLPCTDTQQVLSGDSGVLREKLLDFAKYGILLIRGGGLGDKKALQALGYHQAQLQPNEFSRCHAHSVQGVHTGGAYESAVPSLCVLFVHEEPEDSTIQVVDGFRVASLLQDTHPTIFSFLCSTPVDYHVTGADGRPKSHRWPVFTLTANGSVQQVVFNNAMRSSRINVPPETLEDYYKALKTFNSYCYQARNMYNLPVRKGDAVLVANKRILHGNPAFGNEVNSFVDEIYLCDEPLMQTLKRVQQC